MSKPQTRAQPEVGFISPARIFSVVVLPAAFGPSMAKNSPRGMVSEMSLTAVRPPNFLTRLTSSIMRRSSGFVPDVEGGDETGGQFHAQDFAERAGVDYNRIIEHVGFHTINGHRLAANPQTVAAGFPDHRLGERHRFLRQDGQIHQAQKAAAE